MRAVGSASGFSCAFISKHVLFITFILMFFFVFLALPAFCIFVVQRKAKESGALVKPARPMVERSTMGWMETMCLWKELLQDGVIREDDTITLRMEDYIRKVMTRRLSLNCSVVTVVVGEMTFFLF